jgi:hypothetical protein
VQHCLVGSEMCIRDRSRGGRTYTHSGVRNHTLGIFYTLAHELALATGEGIV